MKAFNPSRSNLSALNLNKSLFVFLAILPALFLGFLVQKYSVNVPYWDQWANLPASLEKIQEGQFSFQYLIEQQNESRPFFPRILFLALAYLTGWNVNYEVLVIFLVACLISFNIFLLSKETIKAGQSTLLFLAFLFNLLIFSPAQWENWLWGIQVIVFVPIACLTANILIAYKKIDIRVKVITQILFCTVSTFSYANGMICWVLSPIALLLLGYGTELRRQKWLIGLWVLSCAANFWLYFNSYIKPPAHPSLTEAFVHPFAGITYFLSFLGSALSVESFPFLGGNVAVAASVGAVLVLLFILQVIYLALFFQKSLLQRLGGWLLIQSYALISALITTFGRVGFGVEQSLSSRYTTFSIYLAIGLIAAVAIIIQDMSIRKPFAQFAWAGGWNQREFLQIIVASLVTALVVMHLLASHYGVRAMQVTNRDRLYAKTCLIFVKFVPDDCIKVSLYPVVSQLQKRAEIVDELNFFQPRLAEKRRIRQSDPGRYSNPGSFGFFDALVPNGNGYTASGWAVLPNEKRVADSVLLTFQRADRSLLLAIAPVETARKDVAAQLRDDRYTNSGWTVALPAGLLPKKEKVLVIEAWAFDTESGKAFKIATSHSVDQSITPGVSN